MKINFRSLDNKLSDSELETHFQWLSAGQRPAEQSMPGRINVHTHHFESYKNYHTVDVIGPELIWMNDTFPKEKFTWYIWFESVFLVPEEMLPFLLLKWS